MYYKYFLFLLLFNVSFIAGNTILKHDDGTAEDIVYMNNYGPAVSFYSEKKMYIESVEIAAMQFGKITKEKNFHLYILDNKKKKPYHPRKILSELAFNYSNIKKTSSLNNYIKKIPDKIERHLATEKIISSKIEWNKLETPYIEIKSFFRIAFDFYPNNKKKTGVSVGRDFDSVEKKSHSGLPNVWFVPCKDFNWMIRVNLVEEPTSNRKIISINEQASNLDPFNNCVEFKQYKDTFNWLQYVENGKNNIPKEPLAPKLYPMVKFNLDSFNIEPQDYNKYIVKGISIFTFRDCYNFDMDKKFIEVKLLNSENKLLYSQQYPYSNFNLWIGRWKNLIFNKEIKLNQIVAENSILKIIFNGNNNDNDGFYYCYFKDENESFLKSIFSNKKTNSYMVSLENNFEESFTDEWLIKLYLEKNEE